MLPSLLDHFGIVLGCQFVKLYVAISPENWGVIFTGNQGIMKVPKGSVC